jgi:energy-coupling factor transport system permease protein
MNRFEEYNPITVAVIYLCILGISMFFINPALQILSFLGAVSYDAVRRGKKRRGGYLWYLTLFLILTFVNPLVSHNGVTVLFFLNNNAITLESIMFGANSGIMILAAILWLRSFSDITTSDRLLYLTGRLSPKISLILSMAIRYVPLFRKQAKKIEDGGKAIGIYTKDSIPGNIKSKLRVFSAMVTWALENGIITADSMSARGYGLKRRTSFSVFKINKEDVAVLLAVCLLFAGVMYAVLRGGLDFSFYPRVTTGKNAALYITGCISYGLLVLSPALLEIWSNIRWKYLISKI